MPVVSDRHTVLHRVEHGESAGLERATSRDAVPDPVRVPLRNGREVVVAQSPDGATLNVRDATGGTLEIEIRFDVTGPVVNVRAKAVSLEVSEQVTARCDTFRVEAREAIELRSGGTIVQQAEGNARIDARNVDVVAEPGAVRLRANDDVQLLGENVLLNCERPAHLPAWTQNRVRTDLTKVPPEHEAGDADLIALLSD